MWNYLLDALEGFFTFLWDSILKPIIDFVMKKFIGFIWLIIAIFFWIKDALIWIEQKAALIFESFADGSGTQTSFSFFSSSFVADMNVFAPVSEFFVMLAATVALMAICYTIRFIKWVKEFCIA